jgi:hypothetical protein
MSLFQLSITRKRRRSLSTTHSTTTRLTKFVSLFKKGLEYELTISRMDGLFTLSILARLT